MWKVISCSVLLLGKLEFLAYLIDQMLILECILHTEN